MAVLDMAATREMSAFDNLPYEVRGALQINGASAILSRSMLKAGLPELDLVLMLENTDAYEFEDFVNSSKRNRKQ